MQVYDDGEKNYISTANVRIYVIVNPSGPLFTTRPYIRDIHETYKEGSLIVDTDAYDLDGVSIPPDR